MWSDRSVHKARVCMYLPQRHWGNSLSFVFVLSTRRGIWHSYAIKVYVNNYYFFFFFKEIKKSRFHSKINFLLSQSILLKFVSVTITIVRSHYIFLYTILNVILQCWPFVRIIKMYIFLDFHLFCFNPFSNFLRKCKNIHILVHKYALKIVYSCII